MKYIYSCSRVCFTQRVSADPTPLPSSPLPSLSHACEAGPGDSQWKETRRFPRSFYFILVFWGVGWIGGGGSESQPGHSGDDNNGSKENKTDRKCLRPDDHLPGIRMTHIHPPANPASRHGTGLKSVSLL